MELLVFFPLLLLIIQDFRFRYIYLWSLGIFGTAQIAMCYSIYGWLPLFYNVLFNLSVLGLISLFVGVYLLLRFKGRLKQSVGWGDLLFIPLLTPYFETRSFLIFLIISFSFTLVGWLIYCYCSKKKEELYQVPLVSGVGGSYLLVLLFNFSLSLL